MARIKLLSNSGAGNGTAANIAFAGEYICSVDGTFDGATVKLQSRSPDGSSWIDIASASVTAEGSFIVALADGREVRAVVSGGTTPAALYCDLDRVM